VAMQLTSASFRDGGEIPKPFTCDGSDQSPPLAWSGAPPGTRSFAVVCRDPDAPAGVWYHWAIFDIPAQISQIAQGHSPDSNAPRQAINDFGRRGYGGPCPPHGHGRHHYSFTVYALSVERLDLPAGARCVEVERAARAHAIANAQLTGIYAR